MTFIIMIGGTEWKRFEDQAEAEMHVAALKRTNPAFDIELIAEDLSLIKPKAC